jgi:TPR repeat protein
MHGCYKLGVSYSLGAGVSKNEVRAAALYKQACDGGLVAGCSNLGALYVTGQGVSKDVMRAAALYKQACDGGEMLEPRGRLVYDALTHAYPCKH